MIVDSSTVTIDYAVKIQDKAIEESTLTYTVGRKQILPYVEQQLMGHKIGDKKTVEVEPQNGYGQIERSRFKEYPLTQFSADTPLEVGMKVKLRASKGSTLIATITELKEETAVLDTNHPLAGKALYFEIEITNII